MPKIAIDRIDTLDAEEEAGRLIRVSRRIRLKNLPGTDWRILKAALAHLDSENILPGASLPGEPGLILLRRRPQLVPGSKTIDVTCEYERQDTTPIWEGDSGVEQVPDRTDANGNPIELVYKYPKDYEWDKTLREKEVKVGAEFTSTKSISEAIGSFIIMTSTPEVFGDQIINKLNAGAWRGKPARTWKVTRVSWVPFNISTLPYQYRIRVHLAHDPDGYDPTVAFVDPNTNEHPPDLLDHVGAMQTIAKLDTINFSFWFD